MVHTAQYGLGMDLRENPTHAFSEYVQHHKQMKTLTAPHAMQSTHQISSQPN